MKRAAQAAAAQRLHRPQDDVHRRRHHLAILLPISYLGLALATGTAEITLYVLAIAFLGNAAYAPSTIRPQRALPHRNPRERCRVAWNGCFALGGMMPALVSWASGGSTEIPMSLSIFVAVIFVLYLLRALLIPGPGAISGDLIRRSALGRHRDRLLMIWHCGATVEMAKLMALQEGPATITEW